MSSATLKKAKKLAVVIKKYDSDLEVLKSAKIKLDEYFEAASVRYSDSFATVCALENDYRQSAIRDAELSVDRIGVRRDYLLQQKELVEQYRLEKERIEQQREGIIDRLREQKLKIQVLEKVKDRKMAEYRESMAKNLIKELDELWLTRR